MKRRVSDKPSAYFGKIPPRSPRTAVRQICGTQKLYIVCCAAVSFGGGNTLRRAQRYVRTRAMRLPQKSRRQGGLPIDQDKIGYIIDLVLGALLPTRRMSAALATHSECRERERTFGRRERHISIRYRISKRANTMNLRNAAKAKALNTSSN